MTQPLLVLAEGTYHYYGGPGGWETHQARQCKVFIVDWNEAAATVILREPAYFKGERVKPLPTGSIRKVTIDTSFGTNLIVDVDQIPTNSSASLPASSSSEAEVE